MYNLLHDAPVRDREGESSPIFKRTGPEFAISYGTYDHLPDEDRAMTRGDIINTLMVFGAALVTLFSGTPNAFFVLSQMIQEDLDLSVKYMSLLTGVGVSAVQLTIFSGPLLDATGPATSAFIGGAAIGLGYACMSFSSSPFLLIFEFLMVGMGSGTCLTASLAAAIDLNNPVAIGMVSLTMSLSLSLTVAITNMYRGMGVGLCKIPSVEETGGTISALSWWLPLPIVPSPASSASSFAWGVWSSPVTVPPSQTYSFPLPAAPSFLAAAHAGTGTPPDCWRDLTRVLGVACVSVIAVGAFLLLLSPLSWRKRQQRPQGGSGRSASVAPLSPTGLLEVAVGSTAYGSGSDADGGALVGMEHPHTGRRLMGRHRDRRRTGKSGLGSSKPRSSSSSNNNSNSQVRADAPTEKQAPTFSLSSSSPSSLFSLASSLSKHQVVIEVRVPSANVFANPFLSAPELGLYTEEEPYSETDGHVAVTSASASASSSPPSSPSGNSKAESSPSLASVSVSAPHGTHGSAGIGEGGSLGIVTSASAVPRTSSAVVPLLVMGGDGLWESIGGGEGGDEDIDYEAMKQMNITSFRSTLWVFRTALFWKILYANMVAIGSGLFVITSIYELWGDFGIADTRDSASGKLSPPPPARDAISQQDFNAQVQSVSFIFSCGTAIGNIFAPLVAQRLGVMMGLSKTTFIGSLMMLMAGIFAVITAASYGNVHVHLPLFFIFAEKTDDPVRLRMQAEELMMWALGLTGLPLGGFFVLFPQTCGDIYGTKNFGRYLSYINLGSCITVLFTPFLREVFFGLAGSYTGIYLVIVLLLVSGAIMLLQMKTSEKSENVPTLGAISGKDTNTHQDA